MYTFPIDNLSQMQEKLIKLSIPKNFSFKQTLSFLDRGFDDCLYTLTEHAVSRLIQLSDGKGLIHINQDKTYLTLRLQKEKISNKNLKEVESFVVEWFDLKRDITPFYILLNKHHQLANFPKTYAGSRLIGIPNLFEAICWAIIGQQINLTFAYKLKRLLVERYGDKEIVNGHVYYTFPSPGALQLADRETLIAMQFSRQKITYLQHISDAFVNSKINKTILINSKNKNERIEKLTSIKGIGIWTANYVLMKSIRDMSCITYGDSGLNKALHLIFNIQKKPTKEEIDFIFKDFKNWESYLNFYLWKSLV